MIKNKTCYASFFMLAFERAEPKKTLSWRLVGTRLLALQFIGAIVWVLFTSANLFAVSEISGPQASPANKIKLKIEAENLRLEQKSMDQMLKDLLQPKLPSGSDLGSNPAAGSAARQTVALDNIRIKMLAAAGQFKSDQLQEIPSLQKEIVSDLDRLIESLKKKCCACKKKPSQSNSKKSGKCKKKSLCNKPGACTKPNEEEKKFSQGSVKDNPEATAKLADKMKKLWGHLPEKERKKMLQSYKQNFYPKYKQELQRYYQRLAEEPESLAP